MNHDADSQSNPLLTGAEFETDAMPDGRQIHYYRWPQPEPRPAPPPDGLTQREDVASLAPSPDV